MERPKFSVILPNYNHGQYLPICLQSIVDQSLPADEIVVVDDASSDNSVEVIKSFAAKCPAIRFYQNERNMGVNYTINRLFSLVTGDLVFGPASDDHVLPGFFEKSVKLLLQYPQAAMSCTIGDWHEVATGWNWQVGVEMGSEPCYLSPQRLVELERQTKLHIPSHTAIMRRKLIPPYPTELRWHSDWFALTSAAYRHGICFVPEPLAWFNIHQTSFYNAGRKKPEHAEVMRNILLRLHLPENQDLLPRLREGAALYHFGWPMLQAIRSNPEWRHLLTPLMLRKCVWHAIKLKGKQVMPRFAADWYFQLAGYRSKPATAA